MTSAEADNLIATLPKPGGLRLYRAGDWIMMTGGTAGVHSIAVGPAALAGVTQLARNAYRALCAAKNHALTRESLVRKLRVGRWKAYSHSSLSDALYELTKSGLVTSDHYGSYTAVCDEGDGS